jgi:hypothetical protein
LVERLPGEDAGIVQVIEIDPDSVIADGLDAHNAHMPSACDQGFLTGTMALNLGGRALDPPGR